MMLQFGASLACAGRVMTPALATAFRRSSIGSLELIMAALADDDAAGGPARSLVRELQAEGTIRVVSLHLPYGVEWDIAASDESERQHVVAKLQAMLERDAEFGAQFATLHGCAEPVADEERAHRLEQACRSIDALLPCLERHQLRLAVEFLPRTCLGNHEAELRNIVDRFAPERVGICLDVNHAMTRYAELPAIINVLADRLLSLHISDYDGVDEKHWFPGQGIIDWPSVMATLRQTGRDLFLCYEARPQLHGCDPIFILRQLEQNIRLLESC